MKRIAEKIILLAPLVSLFMSCSPELEDTSEKTIASLQVTLNGFRGGADTRAQENEYQTSFTGEEQIGVFALKNSGNVILENNVPYKYSAGAWQPVNTNNQIHVYGAGITYYAYYPYNVSMDGKKSVAEITSAFTPPADQSDYDKYTSADLMTGAGILNGGTLTFSFTHTMSLIEIQIKETSNSDAPYDPAPVFYGMAPWKMPDGIYRYLVDPGANVDVEVAFDYGPADNRYAYQKSLAAASVQAGNYTRITAPFKNFSMTLNTGNYAAVLGPVSKVIVNGNTYTATAVSGSNSKYILNGLRKIPGTITSFDVYIADKLAKADSKEQLLVSATTTNLTVDASALTVTLPLSAGGMEGAGTEDDPYQVTTPPQLRGVGVEGTDDGNAETEYYKQTVNLDLTMYADWKPVKSGKLYEGNGLAVSNLHSTQGGIFSYNGGTIQNVHLVSGEINNNSNHAGGIVNYSILSGSKVANCSNAANVTASSSGEKSAGGIVGNIGWGGPATIIDCKNTGSITGNLAGGILGDVTQGSNQLQYCYNEGKITGIGSNNASGGIAGRNWSQTSGFCYNIGVVSGNKSGAILGTTTDDVRTKNCWASSAPFKGEGNMECTLFDDANNKWPVYSTD